MLVCRYEVSPVIFGHSSLISVCPSPKPSPTPSPPTTLQGFEDGGLDKGWFGMK